MHQGLTSAQVAERVAKGSVNTTARRSSRTFGQILRANLLTRFNAIIAVLCGLILVFGQPVDALFGSVIVVNSAVGVIQELRAKRTLDRLTLLTEAPVRVLRDGREVSIRPGEVVVDDLVLLGPGEKVPVDGAVREADGVEIDESLLTGEADPVEKRRGDKVQSGTFVAAGSCLLAATGVGEKAYAARLAAEASRFELTDSELMTAINRLLRLVTWIIVPIGGLLVVRLFTSGASVSDAVVGSVAGVVPMIPEGLVLMTSVAFAVGVIRLGRRRCLVQELPAVEVLARVDTLCIDKTGTLTEPGMALREVRPYDGVSPGVARAALAALARAEAKPNQTMRAIGDSLSADGWHAAETVPFSSARKFSGASFPEHGTWLVGAPDVLLPDDDPARREAQDLAAMGRRVLALVRSATLASRDRRTAALVVLEQRIRADAPDMIRYFAAQGVDVKVISGDDPAAVGAIARQVGIPSADAPADARSLPQEPDALADAVAGHTVFGRATPQRKREFVAALHARGRTVAMTGDGVNDALALKDSDLGVAMGSGSPATRAVAQVVLLGDNFTALPHVLAEGRRVLANIEHVANLFLTKTVYAALLALLVGIAQVPFPFLPRHITLVGTLTIGVPGFFLALAPNSGRARPGFVPRVLRFAVPAGAVAASMTFAAYAVARSNTASSLRADRSTATLTLFLVAFAALVVIARPYTRWRLGLLAVMAGCFVAVAVLPGTRQVADLTFPEPRDTLAGLGLAVLGAAVLVVLLRLDRWLTRVG
ncbi:HAD-IC family P-type ATPase [Micromonospora sp. NPDC007220]|uniref:HAD-IC family P-type ATPase n=1 Tax=Micromonospora sp. NPDC007220 TaxID=3154318 RepID=UPI00340AACC1